MKTKLISQIVLSCSLVLLLVSAAWGAPPAGSLNTYVTPPTGSLDPDLSFPLTMGLQTPVNFSDQSASVYPGHYYIPNELEYLFANTTNCGKLSGIKQVSCVLYTLNANQTVPTDNAAAYQLRFKLKNPATFCAGGGTKTINVGSLSINPQTSFTAGSSTVSINCAALDAPGPSNTNVDLVVSYDTLPPARVENNNGFPVRIRVYNAYASALDIDNVSARIQVPTAFEAVSLAAGCTIDASNLITCNIGNLAAVVTKDFQFRLKFSSGCAAVGNYSFSLSASSSGSVPGKTRSETNTGNNTNIGATTVVACSGGIPPSAGNSVQFKVLRSSIIVADPNGNMNSGGAGKYSGTIDFRFQITTTTTQNLKSTRPHNYTYPGYKLSLLTGLDDISGNPTINTCISEGGKTVTCTTGILAPNKIINQDFRLEIVNQGTHNVLPFNPITLCDARMNLGNASSLGPDIPVLDQLTGWLNNVPGDYSFELMLDSTAIPGLNCVNRTYTQP